MAGFRRGRRGPFVSAKGPKTRLPVAWPFGCPTRFANFGGAQTRGVYPESCRRAQTVSAFPPKSVARLGQATRPGNAPISLLLFLFSSSTPSGWPQGWTLLSSHGPCLSGASWSALRMFADNLCDVAKRGVVGFGDFPRKESHSAAGPRPGNHLNTKRS